MRHTTVVKKFSHFLEEKEGLILTYKGEIQNPKSHFKSKKSRTEFKDPDN